MTKRARVEDLYYTDSIILPGEDDPDRVTAGFSECSDEAYICRWVEAASHVLEAAGYDIQRPTGLLKEETAHNPEHHLAARVIHHAARMARALEQGRILALRRQALLFQEAVDQVRFLEAWGVPVVKQRERAGASRGNIADHNTELHEARAQFWRPWQGQYREFLDAGWGKDAARGEIGERIDAKHNETISWTTLKKWLR